MPFDTRTLGAKLRRIREGARMSQGEVASLAGVSQRTVSRIENGEQQDPGFFAVARVGGVFAISPDQIALWAGLIDEEELRRLRRHMRQQEGTDV